MLKLTKMKTLGIDAGTNSIGWAIRDTQFDDNQIVDYGVITFEKGVASEKGIEFPKVQKRTESRGKRINYRAEKYRKWALLEFLIENKMCPISIEELNDWRKYKKNTSRKYPQSKEFTNWLRFDFDNDGKPDFHLINCSKHENLFAFRAFSIDEKYTKVYQDNPMLLGRILYQLVQRRGFKGRDEEEAKLILNGSEDTLGRNELEQYLIKHKSLGAALYYHQKEKGVRIRKRYNLRKDYENELKLLSEIYSFSEEQYQQLWKAIIWQRPLRTQKGLVGYCIYEKNKKRVQISHPLYEEYRVWNFINNLKISPPEGVQYIDYIEKRIYPLFYKSADFELKVILKQLQKDGASINSKYKDYTKVNAAKLLNLFDDIFGLDWKEKLDWDNIYKRENQPLKKTTSNYSFEDIWHVLNTFDSQENLFDFAINKLNLQEDKALKFSKFKLNQGYATLSLSAIKKIIPFLQSGVPYHYAVFLANIYKVLGADAITQTMIDSFIEDFKEIEIKHSQLKLILTIVNSLIIDEINNEHRYSIEDNRELDNSEINRINHKIKEIIGDSSWDNLDSSIQEDIFKAVKDKFKTFLCKPIRNKENLFVKLPTIHNQVFQQLKDKYNIPDERIKFLWHPSEQENYTTADDFVLYKVNHKDIYVNSNDEDRFKAHNSNAVREGRTIKLLGSPEPITKGLKNPMALKTMHKIKKLINFLIQNNKIDEDTRIVIEIARELNDANKRKALDRWNRLREAENEGYSKIIEEINQECNTKFNPNDQVLIRKIRLWKEQNQMCLYTGVMIPKCEVLNGNKYDLEHTIPASISFDNELKNLTLADTNFNRNIKGKKFPSQLANHEQILNNIKFIEEKIKKLDKDLKEWINKTSYASTKEIKDNCIQRRHLIKMELDYWNYKYNTFTLKEYKASWKNSQLRDTQIITKYLRPYLQTVFKNVSVEKASVVNIFKEIYKVKFVGDSKNRSTHSHHAIDASILTLIPNAYHRERILNLYNVEKDNKTGKTYHELPKDWPSFKPVTIKEIENKIFINNLIENRTTKQTYKTIRKKGKIVWTDKKNLVKQIASGDTIRGQLHGESLYGAIKTPLRNENNQILFNDDRTMKLSEEPILVIRKELVYKKDNNSPGFKNLDELQNVIVDQALFEMIKKQVEEAGEFKTALNNGIWMYDKKGNRVNKIRRVRCKETMKFKTAVQVHHHSFPSKFEYKATTLAKNGENALCLFYKEGTNKGMNILSISEIAQLKPKDDTFFFQEPEFNTMLSGKGKKAINIPLYAILRTGQKVLFYKDSIEELKELSLKDLSKRLYKVYQFESDGRMKFRHHLAAGIDTDLKKINKEVSSFKLEEEPIFLRIRQAEWKFAIDNVDFKIQIDGSINFL